MCEPVSQESSLTATTATLILTLSTPVNPLPPKPGSTESLTPRRQLSKNARIIHFSEVCSKQVSSLPLDPPSVSKAGRHNIAILQCVVSEYYTTVTVSFANPVRADSGRTTSDHREIHSGMNQCSSLVASMGTDWQLQHPFHGSQWGPADR